MSIMNKTIAAAALAALAIPGAAIADGSDRSAEAHKKNSERKAQKTQSKGKAFTVAGVDAANIPTASGNLAGPLTLDPTSANKHARQVLDAGGLTKEELRGEQTVTFGTAGDAVLVRFVGLSSTDTIAPTDRVKVIGKVARSGGAINIRKITVIRDGEQS